MKGLLHSKIFKENLKKWLFMYAGVMLLLTTVITYSKYMTSIQGEDETRASKFDIIITTTSCPSIVSERGICDASSGGKCRPTQEIASCFIVDTTGLEVYSDFYLTFDPALKSGTYYEPNKTYEENEKIPQFDIIGVDTISGNIATNIYNANDKATSSGWTADNKSEPRLKLSRELKVTDAGRLMIRVRMKRNNEEDEKFTEESSSNNLVKVGYSMTQITATKEGGS